MGGETVHKNSMRRRGRNQIFIYLIWLKDSRALISFVLTAHAGPGVGVNRVCLRNRLVGIAATFDCGTRLPCDRACVGHNLGVGLVTRGSSEPDVRTQAGTSKKQRMGDVVSVPQIGKADFFHVTTAFSQRGAI